MKVELADAKEAEALTKALERLVRLQRRELIQLGRIESTLDNMEGLFQTFGKKPGNEGGK